MHRPAHVPLPAPAPASSDSSEPLNARFVSLASNTYQPTPAPHTTHATPSVDDSASQYTASVRASFQLDQASPAHEQEVCPNLSHPEAGDEDRTNVIDVVFGQVPKCTYV